MDLLEPIHDFLLVFLGLGHKVDDLGAVLFTNPIYSAFSLGLVLACTLRCQNPCCIFETG